MTQYIQTKTLQTIDLGNPDYSEISLRTLADALAHVARFSGHASGYSVATHSVLVARELRDRGCTRRVQAGGLLHDLHEAVTGDVSTPMKRRMAALGFDFTRDIELPHIEAIERRFRVHTRHAAIKVVDLAMCNTEADQLLGGRVGPDWPDAEPLPFAIPTWGHARALSEFMDWADRLGVPS